MFRRLPDLPGESLLYFLNGTECQGRAGDTVAAAILTERAAITKRSAVTANPRAAYCMMGVCFECLVTINGVGNRQACLVSLTKGMRVETGADRRSIGT